MEPVRSFSEGDVDAVVIPGIVRVPEPRHGVAIAPNNDTAGLFNRDTHESEFVRKTQGERFSRAGWRTPGAAFVE